MTDLSFFTDLMRGCAPGKVDPAIFFASPKTAESGRTAQAKRNQDKARRTCRDHCPFTKDCFLAARENNESAGIWGGVDMGSKDEKAKAAVFHGLGTAPAARVEPESDEVLVERVLAAGPAAFKALGDHQRATVVRAGLERGMSWGVLERKFRVNPDRLKALVGEPVETFDHAVRRLYYARKSDSAIALLLGCDPKRVSNARARLNLVAIYGPGGRLLRPIDDAQKARREQVPA